MKKLLIFSVLILCLTENIYSSLLPFDHQKEFQNEVIQDTISTIKKFLVNSDLNKNKGLYAKSYEDLWRALILARSKNETKLIIKIYEELGLLYGIYAKMEKAIEFKNKALFLERQEKIKDADYQVKFGQYYYSLAILHRKAKDYNKSLAYLDSCENISKNEINPFVLAEKGKVYLMQDKMYQAEENLQKAKVIFENRKANYLVILYSFFGDLYGKKYQIDKALSFYEKSLNAMFINNSHTDIKADVLKKIASLYKLKNQSNKAYFYLKESHKIADSLFSIRSKNNNDLFEINNKFQEVLLQKDNFINQQEKVIQKQEKLETRLLLIIYLGLFCTVALAFVFIYRAKIIKLKNEKETLKIKEKLEKDKLSAVLDTKKKELTSTALQMIEKDKNIDALLNVIKESDPQKFRKLNKEISIGNKDLWSNFNLRFTELSEDFYKRLKEKHPTLTQTEQKHCALVKLRFDSKEMARLLNISISSVHISRHRIRKKMGLERQDDLTDYIENI